MGVFALIEGPSGRGDVDGGEQRRWLGLEVVLALDVVLGLEVVLGLGASSVSVGDGVSPGEGGVGSGVQARIPSRPMQIPKRFTTRTTPDRRSGFRAALRLS